ncbi:hypothetical protein [Pantoea cypripedii]|nr:hypothetical protein [Pantoea cypripedii]
MSDRIGFSSVHMATSSVARNNNNSRSRLPIARLSQLTLLPASNNPQMPVAPPSYDGYSGPSDFLPPQPYPAPPGYEMSQRIEIRKLGEKFQALFDRRPPVFSVAETVDAEAGRKNLEKHVEFYAEKNELQEELQKYLTMAGVEYSLKIVGKEFIVANSIENVLTCTLRNMGGVHRFRGFSQQGDEKNTTIERPRIMLENPRGVLLSDRSYAQGDSSEVLREITTIWGRIELRIDEDSLKNCSSVYKPELKGILDIIKNRSVQPMDTRL